MDRIVINKKLFKQNIKAYSFISILITLLLYPAICLAGSDPLFLSDSTLNSDTGYTTLKWSSEKGEVVEIEQSTNSNFANSKLVYKGKNRSLFISGLLDGTYYYRMKQEEGAWSSPIVLKVKHHSLDKVFLLFAIGTVIFGSIVFVIIRGAKET